MIELFQHLDFKKLPGLKAQMKMAPPLRMKELYNLGDFKELRDSSVLIPLFLMNKQLHTLLIKRVSDDSIHSGQMAFPGGKYEKSDENLSFTALRETEEEIGISTSEVQIIGQLSIMYIPISGYKVYPFMGFLDQLPTIKLNKSEVQKVFLIPIKEFRKTKNIKNDYINTRTKKIKTPYFYIQNQIIWGATAMIIYELIEFMYNKAKPSLLL